MDSTAQNTMNQIAQPQPTTIAFTPIDGAVQGRTPSLFERQQAPTIRLTPINLAIQEHWSLNLTMPPSSQALQNAHSVEDQVARFRMLLPSSHANVGSDAGVKTSQPARQPMANKMSLAFLLNDTKHTDHGEDAMDTMEGAQQTPEVSIAGQQATPQDPTFAFDTDMTDDEILASDPRVIKDMRLLQLSKSRSLTEIVQAINTRHGEQVLNLTALRGRYARALRSVAKATGETPQEVQARFVEISTAKRRKFVPRARVPPYTEGTLTDEQVLRQNPRWMAQERLLQVSKSFNLTEIAKRQAEIHGKDKALHVCTLSNRWQRAFEVVAAREGKTTEEVRREFSQTSNGAQPRRPPRKVGSSE
ncbi:Hypothetical predicted protein [Lecanosticta acicola]|uniref:Uncharacterized protein n=1 Tax=Lecanosticta acicola TaxID=111012 RepID=A0AAI8YYN8_9PEZI|nr:Hypothetical predicted protein [Lecanosticta acicola]